MKELLYRLDDLQNNNIKDFKHLISMGVSIHNLGIVCNRRIFINCDQVKFLVIKIGVGSRCFLILQQ